jgi:hypothetical protein
MNIIERIKSNFKNRGLYVTLDPNDNSVTFSPYLWKLLKKRIDAEGKSKIIVFSSRINEYKQYGFQLNPDIEGETQLADVQYNGKFDCYGFETLVPTVNRIFFDYHITDYRKPHRLGVNIFYLDWSPKSLEHCVFFMLPPAAS